MKQHRSVFMLWVKSSFYKILGVLVIMILAEGIWFNHTRNALEQQIASGIMMKLRPEDIFEKANLFLFFILAMVATTILLFLIGRSMGRRQEYTLFRLQISPRSVFWWQALYDIGCYFLLWVIQVVVVFLLCAYYIKTADPSAVTGQSLFLAFYRNDFLHALLPLESILCWVRNIAWIVALGISIAYDTYRSWYGKGGFWIWIVLVVGLWYFPQKIGDTEEMMIAIGTCAVALIVTLYRVLGKEKWRWTLDD